MISVIIVSWRAKEKLHACITSLLNFGEGVVGEIIVVDNASNDGTPDLIRNSFPSVTILENSQNLGFSKANNQALKIVKEEYVLFLNPDTEITEHSLQRLLAHIENDPCIVAVGPKLINPDGKPWKVAARRLPTLWTEFCSLFFLDRLFPNSNFFSWKFYGNWNRETKKQVECLVGAAILARKNILHTLSGFDESVPLFLDDIDLCKKLGGRGRIYYCHDAVILHHHNVSGSQQSSTLLQQLSFQAHYIYFKKWKTSCYAWGYATLVLLSGMLCFVGSIILSSFVKDAGRRLFQRSLSCFEWFISSSEKYQCLPA